MFIYLSTLKVFLSLPLISLEKKKLNTMQLIYYFHTSYMNEQFPRKQQFSLNKQDDFKMKE